jgi:hypothetical protein
MRPVSVFAKGLGSEIEQLQGDLHGRWRQATRAVMVLLSLHGLPAGPDRDAAGLPPGHGAPMDQPVQPRGIGRAGRPAAVRTAHTGWAPANRADHRAAGPAAPVDPAPDPALPAPTAHAVPAGPVGRDLAAAQADRPR